VQARADHTQTSIHHDKTAELITVTLISQPSCNNNYESYTGIYILGTKKLFTEGNQLISAFYTASFERVYRWAGYQEKSHLPRHVKLHA
jgi:hypothetical protein